MMKDLSPARWLEERFWHLSDPSDALGIRLGSIMPERFVAYARAFHPADLDGDDEQPVRWSTVASWTGRTVHPLMQFGRLADLPDPYTHPAWGSLPMWGQLPVDQIRTVADILREFTSTADCCYFCIWEGYRFLDPARLKDVSRVRLPGRNYLLFSGPMDSVMSFADPSSWWQSPNIWWPADRAWCVASEIDLFDTYIGGSQACIECVLSCGDLATLPSTIQARIDFGADVINI